VVAPKATDEQIIESLRRHKGVRANAANELGLNTRTMLKRLARMEKSGYEIPRSTYQPGRQIPNDEAFEFTPIPDDDIPIEELVEQRKRKFQHKRLHEESSKLVEVRIKIQGPIGLLHFGDPHVDDDGTDIEALEQHTELCRKVEGLFACNVGDTTNNWVGRLARLYGDQATSASQAWRLAEWFVGRCRWLYMIAGNHDAWSGAGDPLKWMAKQQNSMYKSSEARLALKFPNGLEVRVNARHDHSGSSIWNPAHGPMKAALMGTRDHLYVAGHKHESAYSVLKDPISGITMHACKVASYKIFDRYAKERGFRDNSLSPCMLTTINPDLPSDHPDLIKVWWDPLEGADYLTWMRNR
jgi:hypothetical protein